MAFVFGVPVVALVCVCLFGSGPLIRLVLRRLAYMVLGLVDIIAGIIILFALCTGVRNDTGNQTVTVCVLLVAGCSLSIAALAGAFNPAK